MQEINAMRRNVLMSGAALAAGITLPMAANAAQLNQETA